MADNYEKFTKEYNEKMMNIIQSTSKGLSKVLTEDLHDFLQFSKTNDKSYLMKVWKRIKKEEEEANSLKENIEPNQFANQENVPTPSLRVLIKKEKLSTIFDKAPLPVRDESSESSEMPGPSKLPFRKKNIKSVGTTKRIRSRNLVNSEEVFSSKTSDVVIQDKTMVMNDITENAEQKIVSKKLSIEKVSQKLTCAKIRQATREMKSIEKSSLENTGNSEYNNLNITHVVSKDRESQLPLNDVVPNRTTRTKTSDKAEETEKMKNIEETTDLGENQEISLSASASEVTINQENLNITHVVVKDRESPQPLKDVAPNKSTRTRNKNKSTGKPDQKTKIANSSNEKENDQTGYEGSLTNIDSSVIDNRKTFKVVEKENIPKEQQQKEEDCTAPIRTKSKKQVQEIFSSSNKGAIKKKFESPGQLGETSKNALKASQAEYREREKRRLQKEKDAQMKKQAQAEEKKRKNEERQIKAQQHYEILQNEKEKQLKQKIKDENYEQSATKKEMLQKLKEETQKLIHLGKERVKLAKEKKERERIEQKTRLHAAEMKHHPIYMITKAPKLPIMEYEDREKPQWFRDSRKLLETLNIQLIVDEEIRDIFFCSINRRPNLTEILEYVDDEKLRRTSSGVWRSPPRYSLLSRTSEVHFSEDSKSDE